MNTAQNNITLSSRFKPGLPWPDNNQQHINAHGGGVIHFDGRYYWYGEHKIPGRSEAQMADGGVHCYSSVDLVNWTDEGVVLEVDQENPDSEIAAGCILERPKVLFNPLTQKFVMFFKLYPPGTGMDTGYVGVATADEPAGPFTYQHRFSGGGLGKGTGDFAFVIDSSGVPWHMAVRKPDKVFVAARLRPDFLMPQGPYAPVEGIERHTEAPAIIAVKGGYYLLGSGSTGWAPNVARAYFAPQIQGPYRQLDCPCEGVNPHNNLGPEKTFGGQISFVIPVIDKPGTFIAMFDLWVPELPIEGLYVWLPVRIENGSIVIRWQTEWDLEGLAAPGASKLPEATLSLTLGAAGRAEAKLKKPENKLAIVSERVYSSNP
jgi:Glycosyl hydrolases family 43